MTTAGALGRLFPASLFSILGLFLGYLWRSDPILIGVATCTAAFCMSWMVIVIVDVSKRLNLEPPTATPQG